MIVLKTKLSKVFKKDTGGYEIKHYDCGELPIEIGNRVLCVAIQAMVLAGVCWNDNTERVEVFCGRYYWSNSDNRDGVIRTIDDYMLEKLEGNEELLVKISNRDHERKVNKIKDRSRSVGKVLEKRLMK